MNVHHLRYAMAVTLRSHRIVAPATLFVALVLIVNTDPGPAIETYGWTATFLMPIQIWIALAAAGSEDPPLAATTAAIVGGQTKSRLIRLAVGAILATVLSTVALLIPLVLRNYSGTMSLDTFVSGTVAHLMVIVFGCSFATTVTYPIVHRAGIAFLAVVVLVLAELIVPQCPPVRDVLELFNDGRAHHLGAHLLRSALVTVGLSVALAIAGLGIARRMS